MADRERGADAGAHLAAVAIERFVAIRAVPPAGAELLERLALALDDALVAFTVSVAGDREGGASPLGELAGRAGLDTGSAALLAVAAAVETDETLAQFVVSVTGDRARHRVETWMVPLLLPECSLATVGPAGGLQRAALVDLEAHGAFGRAVVRVAPRVLWALNGDTAPDPDLPATVEVLLAGEGTPAGDPQRSVLVTGTDRTRRRQEAMRRLGSHLCFAVPAPRDERAWAALVREATLCGADVLIEADREPDDALRRWLERATHLRWALSSPGPLALEDLPRLAWRESAADDSAPGPQEWEHAVGPDVPRRHHLTADQLSRLRLALPAHDGDADAAFRRLTSPKLETLTRHVHPRATWPDLILSRERTDRLRDLVDRYRMAGRVYDEWGIPANPSRGLVALFSGPSGTGKTLAAEVVAGQLGLDMYRLDLSSVVSKYIGETEKNLDELFEAAGTGNFVLFFDEADALFAKRGEVSDAHDRYANIETSYLLQRLERYDGVVVLATNYEKNIDQAFLRRIHVRIDFSLPTAAERRAIWQRHLHSSAPLADDIDLAWLVEHFELSGAAIRNAVVDAAFLAAAQDTPIDMALLLRGVVRELHKVGRMVAPDDLGRWPAAGDDTAGSGAG